MSFLSPTAMLIAAGLAVPPLIALYFLKLKRSIQPVSSTLLWKRAVEDLHVNAPFQRLRRSLLLLLQLLVLILAAVALGKPMWQTVKKQEDTVIVLIDQSASMSVTEKDGRSRLDKAKEQAKRCIDNMGDDARAMVISFCDRAIVESPFDADRDALKRRIDSIEQTQSTSTLGEAMSLAEAYAQDIIIGGEEAGGDIAPERLAPPASVFLFTDGRIEDVDKVTLQKFEVSKISVTSIGTRSDNVGILAMDARRNYETPELLEVTAAVQNFGAKKVSVDAVLYVNGQNVDIQTIELAPFPADLPGSSKPKDKASPDSAAVAAFDNIEFAGKGMVEVVLRVDDALATDDRAWKIIEEPRHLKVLFVSPGNFLLRRILAVFPISVTSMTPEQYEEADDSKLMDGRRSAFDVVILDRHSTSRLPLGNYFFWGGVPKIKGVSAGGFVEDQGIFNWDDTHPILRHVAVETLDVFEWLSLKLPPEAVPIIEGQSTPVLSYLTREGSQFLISAFSLVVDDKAGHMLYNTYWWASVDCLIFVDNAIHFLAANEAMSGQRSIRPGQPVTLPVLAHTSEVNVMGPDGKADTVPAEGYQTIHYARTRRVGPYQIQPGVSGRDAFAVNLFNTTESRVQPARSIRLGAQQVHTNATSIDVNQPAWRYFLLALLGVLLLEWVVYNRRVFV